MSTYSTDFQNYRELINDRLSKVYTEGPNLLLDPINHILNGGKRIRPILCLLVNKSLNGNEKVALDCSISVELLHIFSLIHDDIMDGDNLRHSIETIHSKWNISVAVLAGDAVLGLAFKGLNNVSNNIKELFNSALIAVCEGQALDIEYESCKTITLDNYIKMIDLKTGHMISLCMQLGSMTSSSDDVTISTMKSIGNDIGRAFQIQDDLLEVISTSSIMGKNVESDILLNKKTFLTIDASQKIPEKIEIVKNKHKDDYKSMIIDYKSLLTMEGIVDNASLYINNLLKNAEHKLNNLKLYDNCLYEFINYIKDRKC